MLRVRIMGNWSGSGVLGLIDVKGTTNVCDGLYHVAAATYDGSSSAAGVKIYLDGIPQTLITVADSLTTTTITGSQVFYICNQLGSNFSINFMDFYQLHNIARSSSYIASHSSGALPLIDANIVLSHDFEEGRGATTVDGSGNNLTTTFFNSSAYWINPAVFPDATTTGVPIGTTLTLFGSLTISTPGAVVSNLDITGTVTINAANVTLVNCKVTTSHANAVVGITGSGNGVIICDCEINGGGLSAYGILNRSGGTGNTYLRCNIHGSENGIDPGNGDTVQDSYIWSFSNTDNPTPHTDGIEFDGGNNLSGPA